MTINPILLCCMGFMFTGCGSRSGSDITPPQSQTVVITSQPASVTSPIGRAAIFTVAATGTAPLSYQWSENGIVIPDATSSTYTIPVVAFSDSGSSLQVTVQNAISSATSNAVTLTAGARAPAFGDLRYLLWEQVPDQWNNGGGAAEVGATELSVNNAVGAPLQIGSTMIRTNDCGWQSSYLYLPPTMMGLDVYYQEDSIQEQSYPAYLQSVVAPNVVVTSIDLEPACKNFGVSWVTTAQTGGFDYRLETVSPSQVQATVAADGAQSRIVTAATFDDALGDAVLISYGWQGDAATVYEAKTVLAAPADVSNQASILADEGYFISAFGGNDNDGYMLIGMRVEGDNLARPSGNGSSSASPELAPYTVVISLAEPAGSTTVYEQ